MPGANLPGLRPCGSAARSDRRPQTKFADSVTSFVTRHRQTKRHRDEVEEVPRCTAEGRDVAATQVKSSSDTGIPTSGDVTARGTSS